jgi:hypothetical protein
MFVVEPLAAHPKTADSTPRVASNLLGKAGRKTRNPLTGIEHECPRYSVHNGMDYRLDTKIWFQRNCCHWRRSRFRVKPTGKQDEAANNNRRRHERTPSHEKSAFVLDVFIERM